MEMRYNEGFKLLSGLFMIGFSGFLFFASLTFRQTSLLFSVIIILLSLNNMLSIYEKRRDNKKSVDFIKLLKEGLFLFGFLGFLLGVALFIQALFT